MTRMPVTITLIVINVVIFVAMFASQDLDTKISLNGFAQPLLIAEDGFGQWWRLFTSMFIHLSITHIAFNMFALFIFGRVLEPLFGRAWFIVLYLASGLVGGAVYVLIVSVGGPPAAGASGAIFGLFGAMFALAFRRRATPEGRALFGQVIGLLVINLLIGFIVPGIAWQAHLGGLLAGFAIAAVFDQWQEWRPRVAVVAGAIVFCVLVVLFKPVPEATQRQIESGQLVAAGELTQTRNGGGIDTGHYLAERGLQIAEPDRGGRGITA